MRYPISAVSQVTKLSPDVIRSWERRYKIVQPSRDASGVRLYSDADVARLTLAREVTRLGHPIRRVANMADAQLAEILEQKAPEPSTHAQVVARLLDAMHAGDVPEATQLLRRAALLTPTREFVLEIIAPALREVGHQWEIGDLAIWQEHFLSTQIWSIASSLQQPLDGTVRVIFATPPFERHGFGIALAALLAAASGVSAYNLDVTVPAEELVAAAVQLHTVAVVVGITQQSFPRDQAVDYVRRLDSGLPAGVELLLGGAGGALAAKCVSSPRVRSVATLEAFDALCPRWR